MIARPFAFLLGCLLLFAGCASQSQFVPATSDMDRAIRYTELNRRGHVEPLSRGSNDQTQEEKLEKHGATNSDLEPRETATRVPRPALVDWDSTIQIEVLRSQIRDARGGGFLRDNSERLDRKQKIQAALDKLGPVVEALQGATAAYKSKEDFVKKRQDFADKASALLAELIGDPKATPPVEGLWPDDSEAERIQLDDLTEKYGVYEGIRRFLNERIRAIERDNAQIENQVAEKAITLRIQAWLESSGKEPIPIHLEGYDKLDRGQIQQRDRWGIDLTDAEMKNLQNQFKANQQVAAAANSVLDKDKTVGEALLEIAPAIASDLGEIADRAQRLAGRFKSDDLESRMMRIKTAATSLETEIEENAEKFSEAARNSVAAWPAELLTELEKKSEEAGRIVTTIGRATFLREEWQTVTATSLSSQVGNTLNFLRDVRSGKDFTQLPAVGDEISSSFVNFFEKQKVNLDDPAKQALKALATGESATTLRDEIGALYDNIKEAQVIGKKLSELLQPANATLAERTHVPEALKVPIEEVQDTFIELKRTSRAVGDTVTVEVTRFAIEEGKEREAGTTTASFEVERFGWYAKLSPAVVLVQPTKLVSANDGFRFSPTLSWMAQYSPAPYKTGGNAETWRVLQPGIGIHAAFLNFDLKDNQSIQIGLGATVALWKNRLQIGAGYNLMSESSDDGRYYMFIGSDLIGILQSMGLTNP